ncbi:MAG: hypothetical protein HY841_09015 [Bacteroidetes bacterium]|nr:hypothetical protein [Bacteroidota bacterium]
MKPTKDLFDLIKSLTKTEKAYFKKYSCLHVRGEQNKYILLFDAIEKQKIYDEVELLRKFSGYDFVRQFSVAKNYLYHQILNALRSYHHSIHSEVNELVYDAEILFEKELFNQSFKALNKAKQIAKENHLHGELIRIYQNWEWNFARNKHDMNWMKNVMQEEGEQLNLLQNQKTYRELFFKFSDYVTSLGAIRDRKQLKPLEKIIHNKAFSNISFAKTINAKIGFLECHQLYHLIKGENKESLRFTSELIKFQELFPAKIKHNPISYITSLHNALTVCIIASQYKEMPIFLSKLERLSSEIKLLPHKASWFYVYHDGLLHYYNLTGRFVSAIEKIPSILHELESSYFMLKDWDKTSLFSDIAFSYFGVEDFKKCIHWLNRIRDKFPASTPPDYESFFRLFYLLVHYEAGNFNLLPYLIQSAYRFLLKKQQLYKFETIMIHFFRNELPKTNTKKEIIIAFHKLNVKIIPLAKDAFEKNAFIYFNYISWLESKITNRPFAEVVREKANK